jgi:hypothetical protein
MRYLWVLPDTQLLLLLLLLLLLHTCKKQPPQSTLHANCRQGMGKIGTIVAGH